MKINKNTLKHLFYSLLLILLAPSVLAARLGTGISPLDRGIEVISGVFNIEVLKNNEYVQIGFMKFMIFVVLFSVSNAALKKVKGIFDKKTAGIVSFAFSMIGVFMMPTRWLMATGSLITAIMSALIFLGFFIGLSYVAVFKLKKNWLQHLLGILILLFLLFVLDEWALFTGLPLVMMIKEDWMKKIFKPKEKNKWQ